VLRRSPEGTAAWLQGLIIAYGEVDETGREGLGREGLQRHIAVGKARIRAREVQRLMLADLDNDGRVTKAELNQVKRSLSPQSAGRLV